VAKNFLTQFHKSLAFNSTVHRVRPRLTDTWSPSLMRRRCILQRPWHKLFVRPNLRLGLPQTTLPLEPNFEGIRVSLARPEGILTIQSAGLQHYLQSYWLRRRQRCRTRGYWGLRRMISTEWWGLLPSWFCVHAHIQDSLMKGVMKLC
jgi:hypothetical protein